jgi:hypothetical protein
MKRISAEELVGEEILDHANRVEINDRESANSLSDSQRN